MVEFVPIHSLAIVVTYRHIVTTAKTQISPLFAPMANGSYDLNSDQ